VSEIQHVIDDHLKLLHGDDEIEFFNIESNKNMRNKVMYDIKLDYLKLYVKFIKGCHKGWSSASGVKE